MGRDVPMSPVDSKIVKSRDLDFGEKLGTLYVAPLAVHTLEGATDSGGYS
jgi:hypothetical protein